MIHNDRNVYKHWKGNFYRILCLAKRSTNNAVPGQDVVYISLTYGSTHTRDLKEFEERGDIVDGKFVPKEDGDTWRFTLSGQCATCGKLGCAPPNHAGWHPDDEKR